MMGKLTCISIAAGAAACLITPRAAHAQAPDVVGAETIQSVGAAIGAAGAAALEVTEEVARRQEIAEDMAAANQSLLSEINAILERQLGPENPDRAWDNRVNSCFTGGGCPVMDTCTLGSSTQSFFSAVANAYGVEYQLPIGRYSGKRILGIGEQTLVDQGCTGHPGSTTGNTFMTIGQPFDPTGGGISAADTGWAFERIGVLKREPLYFGVTFPSAGSPASCYVGMRYRYAGPKGHFAFTTRGVESVCSFPLPDQPAPGQSPDGAECIDPVGFYDRFCTFGPSYWSTDGQVALDVSNPNAPVLHFPDGSSEVMGNSCPARALAEAFGNGISTLTSFPQYCSSQAIDRNGNTTTWRLDGLSGDIAEIDDPNGGHTIYHRDPPSGRILAIEQTGPSGVPRIWTLNWQPVTWTIADAFPGFACYEQGSLTPVPCGTISDVRLVSVQQADGRSFAFQYGLWGNLTQVTTPDGEVTQYQYEPTTVLPTSWSLPMPACSNPDSTAWSTSFCMATPADLTPLMLYPVRTIRYPNGLAGPGFTTATRIDRTGATPAASPCAALTITTVTQPDLSFTKRYECVDRDAWHHRDGRVLAEELYSASGTLFKATYSGIVDPGSPSYGTLFSAEEQQATAAMPFFTFPQGGFFEPAPPLDFRPTQTVHLLDGAVSTEVFSYDTSSIPASATQNRTYGNVVRKELHEGVGNGGPLLQAKITTMFQPQVYLNGNVLRLPSSVSVQDGHGVTAERTEYGYDEAALASSGALRLSPGQGAGGGCPAGLCRGNVTTTTKYVTPTAPAGPIASHTYYFDNGETQKTQNPLDAAAGRFTTQVTSADFGACYAETGVAVQIFPQQAVHPGASGAAAACSVASGAVSSCTVTAPGSGYTAPPSVQIIGGAGWHATATSELIGTSVTASGIGALSFGAGYTSAPSIVIGCLSPNNPVGCDSANGSGATATATLTGCTPFAPCFVTITLTSGGSGYTHFPSVAVIGGGGTGITAAIFELSPTGVGRINVTSGGTGYQSSPAQHTAVSSVTVNAKGQSTTTTKDCYTGLVLSTVGVNGDVTCNQYDGLGRQVEAATPGDTLSAQPLCTDASDPSACFVRDAACPAAGTAVGNAGAGPTTWTDYHPFGLGGIGYNQAFTQTHTKDGSATGKIARTFVDGAARTLESCTAIDPTTATGAGGSDLTCTFTSYDSMGHAFQAFTPFYASSSMTTATAPASGQYVQSCYDGLGRVIASGLVFAGSWTCGSSPPATSMITATAYGASGNTTVATVTNPNGNQSQTIKNALDQAIETDQYLCATSPCTTATSGAVKLATVMQYDGAGRLTSMTDPAHNATTYGYDGLGRKTSRHDPDLGDWTYHYDDNGNLTSQIDAKNQTITMQYDVLNRVTVKDLPPAGPDVFDVTYFYDGERPQGCYSCFDPTTGVTGFCNTTTATCVNVAGEVGAVCTPGASQGCDNTACDESCGSGACTGATQICNAGGTGWGACTGGSCPPPPPPPTCTPGASRGCDDTTCDESCGSTCTGATQTCTQSGTWGVCTGGSCPPPPPPPTCTPGASRGCDNSTCDESCGSGSCTGATQSCTQSGTWGACTGGSCPCVNGSTRTIACGNCGTETDTCSAGSWTAGACIGQGVCAPGASRSEACGNCGSETDTCSSACQWIAGACTGQGVCSPGSTSSCGNCGTETCSASCQFGACSSQGVCAIGATRSEACSDSLGDTGTETDSCSASCQWNDGACVVCSPGTTRSCVSDICDNCTGTCTPGHQTCGSNGAWGACLGERCNPCRPRPCTQ